jgi:hypothetical protein
MGTHVQFSSLQCSTCVSVSSQFLLIACSLPRGQVCRYSYFWTVFQYLRLGPAYSKLLCHKVEFVIKHFVFRAENVSGILSLRDNFSSEIVIFALPDAKYSRLFFFPHGATAPSGPGSPHDRDHTQTHHDR